ncbi:hypothetical protein GN156_10535 [bacterium LRH843]|nr:hypothetical protein [bacterium LRH843]
MAYSGTLNMMMGQEMFAILSVFIIFIVSGAACVIGIYSILKNNRKRAIWSFVIGFLLILIYLIVMFYFKLISF